MIINTKNFILFSAIIFSSLKEYLNLNICTEDNIGKYFTDCELGRNNGKEVFYFKFISFGKKNAIKLIQTQLTCLFPSKIFHAYSVIQAQKLITILKKKE
jgi:hypothetical protein